MTVLGYDPALVERLALLLRATVDELQRVRSADPVAADALAAVRHATREIEMLWLPLTHQVLAADPLQLKGDGTDLMDTSMLRLDIAGVRALGRMLDTVNLDELRDDPAEWSVLAAELRLIAADPARRTAFRDGFHEWARVADALATERVWREHHGGATTDDVARLDAVFAGLAEVLRGDVTRLDAMQPYSAALVVRAMQLDANALAEVTDWLVLRWSDQPWSPDGIGTAGEFDTRAQPNPADVLFPLLAADPAAARQYVALAGAHPRTLFAATTDPALSHQIVLTATDPARVDTATAGRLLVPLLDWFRPGYRAVAGSAVYDAEWSLFLADAIAPWTLQLGPLNHDWQLSPDHQRALVALLTRDEATITRLLDRADVVRQGVLAQATADRLDEFASYLGMLTQAIVEHRVTVEERAGQFWSLLLGIAGVASTFLPGGLPVSLAANSALGGLGLFGPTDVERARHGAERAKEYVLTTAAAAVAEAVHQQWLADGTLPAGFPAPPAPRPDAEHPGLQFRDGFEAWTRGLPGGSDGALADHVDRLVGTLLNDAEAGAAVAR